MGLYDNKRVFVTTLSQAVFLPLQEEHQWAGPDFLNAMADIRRGAEQHVSAIDRFCGIKFDSWKRIKNFSGSAALIPFGGRYGISGPTAPYAAWGFYLAQVAMDGENLGVVRFWPDATTRQMRALPKSPVGVFGPLTQVILEEDLTPEQLEEYRDTDETIEAIEKETGAVPLNLADLAPGDRFLIEVTVSSGGLLEMTSLGQLDGPLLEREDDVRCISRIFEDIFSEYL